MDTTHPATPTRDIADGKHRPPVKSLTFVLGPPAAPEIREQVADEAALVPVSPDELWIETVRDVLAQLEEASADGRSTLDDMVSAALGELVTVWGVRGALHIQAGRQFPALQIETAQVLDANGCPVVRDFADRKLRRRIGLALLRAVRAEWVTCTAAYQPGGLGFPSFSDARG